MVIKIPYSKINLSKSTLWGLKYPFTQKNLPPWSSWKNLVGKILMSLNLLHVQVSDLNILWGLKKSLRLFW